MQRQLKMQPALLVVALLLCACGARAAQAPVPVLPRMDDASAGKSVFVDDPRFGKDPFFPKSTRHVPQVVQPTIALSPVSAFPQIANAIALKGISGLPGKRLAMLNNRTLEVGEQAEFRINNQLVKIHCVEIREKSVVIGLEGTTDTKEIFLRSGM
jgi:hypothetical protein